jgi:phosphoheptose isomerase
VSAHLDALARELDALRRELPRVERWAEIVAVRLLAGSRLLAVGHGRGASAARQGRPGDVLLAVSSSGRSPNVLTAAEAAGELGLLTLALTGPAPNPLELLADDALCLPAPGAATVRELHLVPLHLFGDAIDRHLGVAAHELAASR